MESNSSMFVFALFLFPCVSELRTLLFACCFVYQQYILDHGDYSPVFGFLLGFSVYWNYQKSNSSIAVLIDFAALAALTILDVLSGPAT